MKTILSEFFKIKENTELKFNEVFSEFSLEFQIEKELLNLDEKFKKLEDVFKSDEWYFKVQIDDTEPTFINSFSNLIFFNLEFNKKLNEIEDENITVYLNIKKNLFIDEITIYSPESFFDFLENLTVYDFLLNLSPILLRHKRIRFKTINNEKKYSFKTGLISFNSEFEKYSFEKEKLPEGLVFFGNSSEFPFFPSDFHVFNSTEKENSFISKLGSLEAIFSIIRIFDISSILKNDENLSLNYRLNGYRSFEGEIDLNSYKLFSLKVYFKIFIWIYSEPSKAIDKIGIARNILSLFLQENNLEINDSVFDSILSSHKTYLQNNLNKYIEIRGKIKDQLSVLTQRANTVAEAYLINFEKSVFGFISFFISIFLIRVISTKDFSNIFSKDVSIIGFGLLGLSLFFLIYSLNNIKAEIKRLKSRYADLKISFEDLLLKEDINKILQDDKIFKSEINFLTNRLSNSSFLWVFTLILLGSIIVTLSDTYNWNFFLQKIINIYLIKRI